MNTRTKLIFLLACALAGCGSGPEGGSKMDFGITGTRADAGGWSSSGGGDLIGDLHNPWFISANTPEIKVCFVRDAATFSASLDQAREAFERAAGFWTRELDPARLNYPAVTASPTPSASPTPPIIAVQMPKFIEQVPCQGDEDIQVVMGWGALTAEQLSFMQGQSNVVAMAVRTSYDITQLRGKGFIFVQSDQGPAVKDNPRDGWAPKVWSADDNRLAWVLGHELGHVLGMPHQQSIFESVQVQIENSGQFPITINFNLMSERFPEELVLTKAGEQFTGVTGFNHLVDGFVNIQESCSLSHGARYWVNSITSRPFKCLAVDMSSGQILAGEKGSETLIVGQVDQTTIEPKNFNVEPVVIFMGSQPTPLFSYTQSAHLPWATIGPFSETLSMPGVVDPVGDSSTPLAAKQPIIATFGPQGLVIQGFTNNRWDTWFISDDSTQPKF